MKNPTFALILVLALFVSACDTEGVFEPVQGDVSAPAVPVTDKALLQKTIEINEIIGDAEGIPHLYLATGEIRYTMVDGPWATGLCRGYTIHSTIEGVVTPLPNDQALWSFQGQESVSICIGNTPYLLSFTCPISGRSDGAVLRLDLSATPSGMVLDGLSIEVPAGDITPVAD